MSLSLPNLLRQYAVGVEFGMFDKDLTPEQREEVTRLLKIGAESATTRKEASEVIDDAARCCDSSIVAYQRALDIVVNV
jgi:hypothetical protein